MARAVPITHADYGPVGKVPKKSGGERTTPVLWVDLSNRPDLVDTIRIHGHEIDRDPSWHGTPWTQWRVITPEGSPTYLFLDVKADDPARYELTLMFNVSDVGVLKWIDWMDFERRVFLRPNDAPTDRDAYGLLITLGGESAIDLLMRHMRDMGRLSPPKPPKVPRGRQSMRPKQ